MLEKYWFIPSSQVTINWLSWRFCMQAEQPNTGCFCFVFQHKSIQWTTEISVIIYYISYCNTLLIYKYKYLCATLISNMITYLRTRCDASINDINKNDLYVYTCSSPNILTAFCTKFGSVLIFYQQAADFCLDVSL